MTSATERLKKQRPGKAGLCLGNQLKRYIPQSNKYPNKRNLSYAKDTI
jgi:hypothetical protein